MSKEYVIDVCDIESFRLLQAQRQAKLNLRIHLQIIKIYKRLYQIIFYTYVTELIETNLICGSFHVPPLKILHNQNQCFPYPKRR